MNRIVDGQKGEIEVNGTVYKGHIQVTDIRQEYLGDSYKALLGGRAVRIPANPTTEIIIKLYQPTREDKKVKPVKRHDHTIDKQVLVRKDGDWKTVDECQCGKRVTAIPESDIIEWEE